MKGKINTLDKYTRLAIIIIILGIIIRFALASIYQVSGDACWQLSNSKFIAENLNFPVFDFFGRDEPFWAPPLFNIITASIYAIFNNLGKNIAEFAIKMISPLFGSLTLIFFFLIAKNLFNKKIAFYSLLFLTFIPLHIDYSVFSYVDGTVTFLAVLSVYLAIKNRIILSAIVAGLAILTKYNGIFVLPVVLFIIYLKNKNKKTLIKNLILISVISFAIGSLWFIRNWVYLGNPVWPFLNNLFNGYETKIFAEAGIGSLNLLSILSFSGLATFYLGFFGIPNGDITTLSFLQLPYPNILFGVWFLSTLIFLIPLISGIASRKLKHKNLLYIWITSYIILIFLYIINSSWSVSRFMLPAFPALALIWAYGLQKIKSLNIRNILTVLIVLIMLGFVFTSFLKIGFAAKAWNFYNDDFEWVRSNTNKNSIFLTGGQCISYNIERQTTHPEVSNMEKADYVWVNQDFGLERTSLLNQDVIKELDKNAEEVYKNKETNTKIYKIKRFVEWAKENQS